MVQEGCGERRCLSLIDGASALHARNEPVFVQRAEVGRWQIHKRQNMNEYLPNSAKGRRSQNPQRRRGDPGRGSQAELGKIFRQLEGINPSAGAQLGMSAEGNLHCASA